MPARPLDDVVLDHVAVAVEHWSDAWPCYVGRLGGRWSSGGFNVGFAPAQLRFANDARLEVLQPHEPQGNDFLRRFLDHSGPGPHHLTFKVRDIRRAIAAAEEAGFPAVQVDLADPGWMEAFLHPRSATGVVVQLAQAASSWESPAPEGFPAPATPAATLRHVTHAVADLEAGLALFAGVLGGEPHEHQEAPDGSWRAVTLRWAGPLALRLVAPAGPAPGDPLTAWLGGRAGRVHHLALSQPGPPDAPPAAVAGVGPHEQPCRVIDPADNLGVRLVLTPAT